MPGDVIRSVRSQEDSSPLQILFISQAAQRNPFQKSFAVALDHNFRHVGGEPPGSDGIHLDIMDGPLAGQVFREGDYPSLAGVIRNGLKFRRSSVQAGYGCNVNNFSATLSNHDLANSLGKQKSPGQV